MLRKIAKTNQVVNSAFLTGASDFHTFAAKITKMKKTVLLFALSLTGTALSAQVIRGTVRDAVTSEPIPLATVLLVGENKGTAADADGQFMIQNATLGRHTVQVSSLGYESSVIKEVMVNSARETRDVEYG